MTERIKERVIIGVSVALITALVMFLVQKLYVIPAEVFIPSGTIVAFHPSDSIPPGWVICNGKNGTPDLTNKFILGADGLSDQNLGKEGGSASHSHSISVEVTSSSEHRGLNDGGNDFANASHNHQASAGETEALPPHVKLIYIMKK